MNGNNNFYQKMEGQIEEMNRDGGRKRLLLHCCCAPCSSHCLDFLHNYFDITAYFYNPNITDEDEYLKRYFELKRFIDIVYDDEAHYVLEDHEPEKFYEIAKGREMLPERGARCYDCYKLRLEKSAEYAKKNNFDAFTTTLSISPHKNANWLNEIGQEMAEKYGITYLFSDFKKKNGYKHSIELSKEYNLYRQDFCGCEFSKKIYEENRLNNGL